MPSRSLCVPQSHRTEREVFDLYGSVDEALTSYISRFYLLKNNVKPSGNRYYVEDVELLKSRVQTKVSIRSKDSKKLVDLVSENAN